MVERKEYLAELVGWKDEQVIKVVTGIRRCGKSTLLAQYQDWLRVNGVTDAQIVSVNFEELEYEELLDYKKLYAYLKERLVAGRTTYIFLDEIQKVADFEKGRGQSVCQTRCGHLHHRLQCVYALRRSCNAFDRPLCGD